MSAPDDPDSARVNAHAIEAMEALVSDIRAGRKVVVKLTYGNDERYGLLVETVFGPTAPMAPPDPDAGRPRCPKCGDRENLRSAGGAELTCLACSWTGGAELTTPQG